MTTLIGKKNDKQLYSPEAATDFEKKELTGLMETSFKPSTCTRHSLDKAPHNKQILHHLVVHQDKEINTRAEKNRTHQSNDKLLQTKSKHP